jgi:hypothetical protein
MWDTVGLLVATTFGIPLIVLMHKVISGIARAYNEGKNGV